MLTRIIHIIYMQTWITYIHIHKGVCGVIVILVGNGHGEPSSDR